MTADRVVFVTWQEPERRGILPVGRLVQQRDAVGELYEFRYVQGALEAMNLGFRPFLAFPELYKTYRSRQLFAFFTNRVMRPTRPDYSEYVEMLGLEPSQADSMSILARSGGPRETDTIKVVPPPIRNEETGASTIYFFLRGMRYTPGAEERIGRLHAGDSLLCMLDVQNPANPKAVALRTEDKCFLGYIPDYLTTDIATLAERKVPLRVVVERVNPPPTPLRNRLLCRLDVCLPDDFAPFQRERLRPVEPLVTADFHATGATLT